MRERCGLSKYGLARDSGISREYIGKIDPFGFTLENFDAIGGWRANYSKDQKIDPGGDLPAGEKFSGVNDFRLLLIARHEQFTHALSEKLLTYSHGFRTDGLAYGERKKRGEVAARPPVKDVTHRRQIHFLREAGCWVVTDRIHSVQAHDFTQSWCVGPEFTEKEVEINPAARTLRTTQATGPNLCLFQFGSPNLSYERYFGVRDDNHILGWVGIMPDREKWTYTPAVAVHANWRGQGEQLLVTLMVPRPGAPERVSGVKDASGAGVSGFDAVLPDGRPVAYRAVPDHALMEALGLKTDASSLLAVRHSDGRLTGVVMGARSFNGQAATQPDFEFDLVGSGQPAQITPINSPKGVRWVGTGKQLVPEYSAPAW